MGKYLRTIGDTPHIVDLRIERRTPRYLHTPTTGMEAIERSRRSTRDSVHRTAGAPEWEEPEGTDDEIRERVLRDLGVTNPMLLRGKKPEEH